MAERFGKGRSRATPVAKGFGVGHGLVGSQTSARTRYPGALCVISGAELTFVAVFVGLQQFSADLAVIEAGMLIFDWVDSCWCMTASVP